MAPWIGEWLAGWLIRYILNKLADAGLSRLAFSEDMGGLVEVLDNVVTKWGDEIRKIYESFYEGPLFVRNFNEATPGQLTQPAAQELWECFLKGQIPSESVWLQALEERWQSVRCELGEDAEDFFKIPTNEASIHLGVLAKRLHRVCAENQALFQASAHAFHSWARVQLEEIAAHLKELDRFICEKQLIHAQLRSSLKRVEEKCRTVNRAYHTPDLLLALLTSRDGHARRCFDAVDISLTSQVVDGFTQSTTKSRPNDPFVEFDWERQKIIQNAGHLAAAEGHPEITHKYLLLAILDGDSNTVKRLRNHFGEQKFAQIRKEVIATPADWFPRKSTDPE